MQHRQGVQSLARAFELLELIASHHEASLSQTAIQAISGLDRTTVHRMLSFLASKQYIVQTETPASCWRLGLRAMGMGLQALAQPPVVERLKPIMKTLARHSEDNVFLICRMGDMSFTLHLEQGRLAIPSYTMLVGTTRLLGLGTGSMALLAALPDELLNSHLLRHQSTYSAHHFSPLKIQRAIQRTRKLGYTLASDPEVSGAGVAFDLEGLGLVGLSILSSRPRMPVLRRHAMAQLILAETAALRSGAAA
jgi:DNA-binding IclR family transcriptional regulator